MRQRMWTWVAAATVLFTGTIHAADAVGPDAAALKAARQKAVAFLKTSQSEDGSWTSPESPGITGLVTFGLISGGATADDPAVAKAVKHLLTFVQPDGGIYFSKSNQKSYETGISMMVFATLNKGGMYDKLLADAGKYARTLQWDETEKTDKADMKYGGIGYGRSGDRPDLSNTVFFLEALQASGVKKDDPAVQKALVFLSRCQNLETENNTTPFASKVNDGGFYYTPAAGGQSQAGTEENGGLRSYGSMTYAGLKSMIYAGLTADDPRVKSATEWIKKFYTVSENPGLKEQGYYYYTHMFAKALTMMGEDQFADATGKKHDWRKELAENIFGLQKSNGSWVNSNARWMEGDPNLTTAYTLMALKYCDPKPAK